MECTQCRSNFIREVNYESTCLDCGMVVNDNRLCDEYDLNMYARETHEISNNDHALGYSDRMTDKHGVGPRALRGMMGGISKSDAQKRDLQVMDTVLGNMGLNEKSFVTTIAREFLGDIHAKQYMRGPERMAMVAVCCVYLACKRDASTTRGFHEVLKCAPGLDAKDYVKVLNEVTNIIPSAAIVKEQELVGAGRAIADLLPNAKASDQQLTHALMNEASARQLKYALMNEADRINQIRIEKRLMCGSQKPSHITAVAVYLAFLKRGIEITMAAVTSLKALDISLPTLKGHASALAPYIGVSMPQPKRKAAPKVKAAPKRKATNTLPLLEDCVETKPTKPTKPTKRKRSDV